MPPYRAARIEQMIENAPAPLTTRDVHRMQLDVYDLHALRYRGLAIDAARAQGLDTIADALSAWDGRATVDSRVAGLWYGWYHRMRESVGRDFWNGEDGPLDGAAIDAVLEARALPWRSDGDTAFSHIAGEAIHHAARHTGGRPWGELHQVIVGHAMGDVASLERLLRLNVGPDASPGSWTTVNVSQWLETGLPVVSRYGPSQRHVVDLGDVDGAGGFILPAGQSGNPLSPHYRDQHHAWLNGGLWRIPVDPAIAESRAVAVTTLRGN
jgi:penicillin amidase